MTEELTRDEHLKLIELETKNLEFLYKSYPEFNDNTYKDPSQDPRLHYIGVAHSEQRKMLDTFYKKWNVKQP